MNQPKPSITFSRRKLLLAAAAVAAAGFLAAALLFGFFMYLPTYLETSLLKKVGARYGIELKADFRRLGLSGIDFGDVELTGPDGKKLRIDSLRIDYSPEIFSSSPLLRVKEIQLSGIDVAAARLEDGGWKIDGIDLLQLMAEKDGGGSAGVFAPPFALERIRIRYTTLTLSLFNRTIKLPLNADLFFHDGRIAATAEFLHDGKPLFAAVELKEAGRLIQFELSGAIDRRLAPELPAALEPLAVKIAGTATHGEGRFTVAGNAAVQLPAAAANAEIGIEKFSGRYESADQSWQFAATGVGSAAEIGAMKFDAEFSGRAAAVTGSQLTAEAAELQFQQPKWAIRIPRFRLSGNLEKLELETALELQIPNVPKLLLGRISGSFPAARPRVAVTGIQLEEQVLGTAEAAFEIGREGIEITGAYQAGILKDLALRLTGTIPYTKAKPVHFELNLPPWTTPEPIYPGRYWRGIDPRTNFTGTFSFGGVFEFADGKLGTGGGFMMRDGKITIPDHELTLENVDVNFRLLDLIAPRTRPGQTVNIEAITFGKMRFRDAALRFQLDSPTDFLLESAQIGWCGGVVNIRALRLGGSQRRIRTHIYCDRLQLADAISQLSGVKSSGTGILSGRIPIELTENGLVFEEGYLHSDPGIEGKINIADAETLLVAAALEAAAPVETDLACESLKSFIYEWAKLKMSTTAEDLLVNLQFEGRPANPLPFGRDPQTGRLTRDAKSAAEFQGITINLNVKLPLNRLLKLNDKINLLRRTLQ